MVMQVYYPYIALRVSKPLQMAVTETLVWRIVEMNERLNLGAATADADSKTGATTSDSPLRIALVNMSDLAAFLSFRGDPLSRPRWAAAMSTLSWGLDMANFEAVPVRLQGFEMQDVAMLSSVFVTHVIGLIKVRNGHLLCLLRGLQLLIGKKASLKNMLVFLLRKNEFVPST